MRIRVVNLKTGEAIDVTKHLYWFEEQGVTEMDEHGEMVAHNGERYRLVVEEEASV